MSSVVRTPKLTGRSKPAGHVADPARGFARHVVEMRRLATHHGAETDERIVPAGGGEPLGAQRQLERPRHHHHVDGVLRDAVLLERLERAREQGVGDGLVEPRHDDAHPQLVPAR
jgi:hypothetical protein